MKLVSPDKEYLSSYLEAYREGFCVDGCYDTAEEIAEDFNEHVLHITDFRTEWPDDEEHYDVPYERFWLINDDKKFVGTIVIRYTLNDFHEKYSGHISCNIRPSMRGKGLGNQALELALLKAKSNFLKQVLVSCEETNSPAAHIIEKNGGDLIEKVAPDWAPGAVICRYMISL